MKDYLYTLARIIGANVNEKERFFVSFSGEIFDFARFNHAQVRQAGTIKQNYLDLELINGNKHASVNLGLSHNLSQDQDNLLLSIGKLREQLMHSQDDPFFMMHDSSAQTENITTSMLPGKEDIIESVLKEGEGLDLVGYCLSGPIFKGFASSSGQFNWFEKSSFIVDISIYHSADKAIKLNYADTSFQNEILAQKISAARNDLTLYDKEPIAIKPGHYNVYFSPAAVYEMLGLLNWGGFSHKSLQLKNSPLLPLFNDQKSLSPLFGLSENIDIGIGPNFQSQGFMKKGLINIIDKGRLKGTLISPNTAMEYHLDHNGAEESESMTALDMAPGTLRKEEVISTLGEGLYINNLWYLNFSDRQNGCLTGMTRFFCSVIKNESKFAPLAVMRFDDSIYRIFGENLRHITKEREMIIDGSTYDERSTTCALLPGVIAENVRFTL